MKLFFKWLHNILPWLLDSKKRGKPISFVTTSIFFFRGRCFPGHLNYGGSELLFSRNPIKVERFPSSAFRSELYFVWNDWSLLLNCNYTIWYGRLATEWADRGDYPTSDSRSSFSLLFLCPPPPPQHSYANILFIYSFGLITRLTTNKQTTVALPDSIHTRRVSLGCNFG